MRKVKAKKELMFHPEGPSFWELARQCLSSTERGYDLLSPKFDVTPFRTPDQLIEEIVPHLGDRDDTNAALDLCCGTGAGMRILRPLCRDRVVGLDFSQGMLEVGRERTANVHGDASLQFVRADALQLPFCEEFDIVVSFGAFGHILPKDEPRMIQQVHRSLRTGGRFVFVTAEKPSLWRREYWLSRGFNGAMQIRNLFWRPQFIMYYLTFLLPRAKDLLEDGGFAVETLTGVFAPPWDRLQLVIAEKKP